jgi:hypothetical protein
MEVIALLVMSAHAAIWELWGLCRFDLAHYLDGQPMQFMMRPRSDKAHPYFAFEMWHEKLLPAAQRHHH